MPRRNRFEMAYARIETILCRPLADLEPGDVVRLRSRGFMDLVAEMLSPCECSASAGMRLQLDPQYGSERSLYGQAQASTLHP